MTKTIGRQLLAAVDCPELGRIKGNWYTAGRHTWMNGKLDLARTLLQLLKNR